MGYIPKACGFIVVRPVDEGWAYLLLTSRKWAEPGFPKGHVDEGESELETARRETEEEAGLVDLEPARGFRAEIRYPVERKGKRYEKASVYYLAKVDDAELRLSDEHTEGGWHSLAEANALLPHDNTRGVLREAALYLKDPGLFALDPPAEEGADAWLRSLPKVTDRLVAHLRGGARLARSFAAALAEANERIHVDATAVGALLHDAGRALGRHDDHQTAGLDRVRQSPFAPYGFACISHFTKGASTLELIAAGIPEETARAFAEQIDAETFTLEEQCVSLADACMRSDQAVPPALRFADVRKRYGRLPIIDLQERRTCAIRAGLAARIGRDPLAIVGLDG